MKAKSEMRLIETPKWGHEQDRSQKRDGYPQRRPQSQAESQKQRQADHHQNEPETGVSGQQLETAP